MADIDAECLDLIGVSSLEEPVRATTSEATDTLGAEDLPDTISGKIIRDRLHIQPVMVPNQLLHLHTGDTLVLQDYIARAVFDTLTDGIELGVTPAAATVIYLLERLRVSDALGVSALMNLSVVEAVRLVDDLTRFFGADMEDGIALGDTLAAMGLHAGNLVDGVALADALTPQFFLSASLSDGIDITGEMAVQMLFNPTIIDGVEISAGYVAPDGTFTTWAMNTRTGAVTEYDNFVFNSFAQIGNVALGASSDGLYELLGDNDEGTDIVARIRSGFMQFGGTKLSRLKAAYIAMRGEGEVLLKIEEAGSKTYVYRVDTRDMRSTKVHMGKGQRARYFAFELVSDGQDFDLDTIEFVPIVVQRRV